MKISLAQISISDRVNAAKTDPSSTDTSQIPTSLNPSPGDSTITPIDTAPMKRAGSDVNTQSQQANRGTSDSSRKGPVGEAGALQYENREVNPDNQAPSPNRAEDVTKTPQPRSKGFTESLLDKQVSGMMSKNTGGDHPSRDVDQGKDTGDPNNNVKKAPQSQIIRRDKIANRDNSNINVKDPANYQNAINTEGIMSKSTAPNLKLPNIKMPNIRTKF